ncbi:MAG: MFS transporter [Calothrix sp. SM1_5_4]|nr:MFS transporter [Calothrix sp. SM1_5_4]
MKSWKAQSGDKYPLLYQWSTVIGGLDFSRSIFLIYFSALGFSGTQTGWLQAALFWTSFALEIPSGIFADKFGRKISISGGFLLFALAHTVLATATTFTAALVGFVFWGAAFAFLSGAASALLYDGLKEAGRLDSHIHWLARTRSIGTVAMGLAIMCGGVLYDIAPAAVFWATAAAATLGLVLIQPVPEPRVHGSAPESPSTLKALGIYFGRPTGRNLLIFLAGMAAIEMAVTPFFIFSQNLFSQEGLSPTRVSLILGGGFLASSLAQSQAAKARSVPVGRLVAAGGLAIVLALSSFALVPAWPVQVALFALLNVVPAFLYVHTDQYIQEHCESHIRASVLSVQSFANSVLVGFAYLGVGVVSDRLGLAVALALLTVPVVFGLALVAGHFKRIESGR